MCFGLAPGFTGPITCEPEVGHGVLSSQSRTYILWGRGSASLDSSDTYTPPSGFFKQETALERWSTASQRPEAMAKWISSARDLPLILSRGVAAVTSEPPKRPLAFLRARELHVQEAGDRAPRPLASVAWSIWETTNKKNLRPF